MGSQCTQAPFLGGEPVPLSSTSSSKLCAQCEEAGLSPDDVPEGHDELFHAARVLFEEGVADDDLIIPTLAFAARASVADKPWLAQLKDLLLKTGGSSEEWESLWRLFIDTFDTLQPDRIANGVPILRRVDLYVHLFDFDPAKPEAWVVKEIYIDVYSRSVKPPM